MKIQREVESIENLVPARKPQTVGRRTQTSQRGLMKPDVRLTPEDLLLDGDLAFDREEEDVAVLADQVEREASERAQPWNADEDVLREFHRAATRRGSRSVSGRML